MPSSDVVVVVVMPPAPTSTGNKKAEISRKTYNMIAVVAAAAGCWQLRCLAESCGEVGGGAAGDRGGSNRMNVILFPKEIFQELEQRPTAYTRRR